MKNKKNKIETFSADLLSFSPDVRMESDHRFQRVNKKGRILAAGGEKYPKSGMVRIGVLTEMAGNVPIRVFDDHDHDCYRLYILFNNRQCPTNSVVTFQNSFKFYLVDQEGVVVIPKVSRIDPLEDVINLSFPEEDFVLRMSDLVGNPLGKAQNGKGSRLEYDYDEESGRVIFMLLEGRDRHFSKLMVVGESTVKDTQVIRLVAFRNGTATVRLSESIREEFHVCLYK